MRRPVGCGESTRPNRAAHRPARCARARDQPPQTGGSAVRAGWRSGSGGQRVLCHRGGRLRAHSPRSGHRPRRPARHRTVEPPRLRHGSAVAVSRDRHRDRRRHAPLPRPAECARRRGVLHEQCGRAGSRARARGLEPGAHQPVRHLLWHAGRAALPAPLPAARPRRDSRWCRAGARGARAGYGDGCGAGASQHPGALRRRARLPQPLRRSCTHLPQRACRAQEPRGAGDGGRSVQRRPHALQFHHRAPGDGAAPRQLHRRIRRASAAPAG